MGVPILRGRGILAIIDLFYYIPVLIIAILVCRRHGFKKQLGWLSIVVLACFRISASSTWIAASYDDTINGLVTASIILSSFGLVSIIFSIKGLLLRLIQSMPDYRRLPTRAFKLAHLATSVGIGLAIAGAIQLGDSKTGNDPEGHTLQRAAMIIFNVIFAFLCITNVQVLLYRGSIPDSERPLLIATCVALPLLFSRLLFGVLAAFGVAPRVFSLISQNRNAVIATAVMATLPEFIIAAVILGTGFKVPRLEDYRGQVDSSNENTKLEA